MHCAPNMRKSVRLSSKVKRIREIRFFQFHKKRMKRFLCYQHHSQKLAHFEGANFDYVFDNITHLFTNLTWPFLRIPLWGRQPHFSFRKILHVTSRVKTMWNSYIFANEIFISHEIGTYSLMKLPLTREINCLKILHVKSSFTSISHMKCNLNWNIFICEIACEILVSIENQNTISFHIFFWIEIIGIDLTFFNQDKL